MKNTPFRGLYTAVTTAISADYKPDFERSLSHWHKVIATGSHGICPFGTTGEGVAFSVSTRIALLEAAAASSIPATNIMPVVGTNSISDAVELVAHAQKIGCPGVLVLPPSYYKNPSADGVFEFYAQLIEQVGDDALRLFVYNIPQLTGVVIAHSVVDKLIARFGPIIAGIKDSWGKLEHTLAYIEAFSGIAIFTGTDHHIVETMRAGGAGTVTGMGNINPGALRKVVDTFDTPEGQQRGHIAGEIHLVVEKFGGVPAMKAVIAHYRNDPQWAQMTPPLIGLTEQDQRKLIDELEAAGFDWYEQQLQNAERSLVNSSINPSLL